MCMFYQWVVFIYGKDHIAICKACPNYIVNFYRGLSTHMLAGVYLSFYDGIILESNSSILITDIGTSSPQQLVCTSDRMPCCLDQPQYGEWYFPDGSQVVSISEMTAPLTFYRDRDNNGNVILYRVSSDVTSPTGSFCCEIEDATDTNQTLYVNLSKSHHAPLTLVHDDYMCVPPCLFSFHLCTNQW